MIVGERGIKEGVRWQGLHLFRETNCFVRAAPVSSAFLSFGPQPSSNQISTPHLDQLGEIHCMYEYPISYCAHLRVRLHCTKPSASVCDKCGWTDGRSGVRVCNDCCCVCFLFIYLSSSNLPRLSLLVAFVYRADPMPWYYLSCWRY